MNPVLVEIYRNEVMESFHRGVICVVNKEGQIIYSEGDVYQVCYPRSAMKLLQVIPLIEHGGIQAFGFTEEEIALICGSHNAEPEHLRVVNSILLKAGLDQHALCCGPQYPTSGKEANALIRKGEKPHDIHNNCSGKHAGMLAMCVLMNWPTEDYINPRHPLQQMIREVCADMYEYPEKKMITALDGCSAPVFSVPVYNQAVGYKNLVYGEHFSGKRKAAADIIIDAISRYPFMVAGSKRYCTDMMQVTAPRIIGKTGAEGIFCMSLTLEKMGVCIKIDDGKMAPQYNIAQAFIEATGIFPEEKLQPLRHYMNDELKNFNQLTTGRTSVRKGLFETFRLDS